MATLKDVAQRAEVSTSTVAAILNESPHCYASAATRQRVRTAAAEVGYRPNRLARALVRGESGLFGLLTIDAATSTFSRAVNGVEDAAAAAGYGLLLCHTHTRRDRERQHMQMFGDSAVEGIVSVAPSAMERADEVLDHRPPGMPFVSVNRPIDAPGVLSILLDNREASRQLTEHLIRKGHRRVVYLDVAGTEEWARLPLHSSVDRRDGYEAAMRAAALPPEVVVLPLPRAEYENRIKAAGDQAIAMLAGAGPTPPTAFIGVTDLEAVGVLYACVRTGRRVPEDVAIAGFDDLDIGRLAFTPITSVRQSFQEAGKLAVERLIARKKEPLEGIVRLESRLCLRASTGDV